MHLGAVTYNVLKDWDLDTIIQKLPPAGFEAVELRTGHAHGVEPSLDAAARAGIKARFEKSKVRLLSLGSTCEFQSPDPEERKKQLDTGRKFIELAHDVGALGVKMRPNGLPKDKSIPLETTVKNIGAGLREMGEYGNRWGVEVWLEVHGPTTQTPPVAAAIMKATDHKNVGLCWNSNPTDIINGSVRQSFELLRPWIRNCHIHDLIDERYPFREFFGLLQKSKYERYTLCEAPESKEPERFLRYYSALWRELQRS